MATFSPSVYKRRFGLKDTTNTRRMGSAMSLLMEAKEEVKRDQCNKVNEIIAHRIQRKEEQYAQKMEEQEEEDRRTAAKLQMEENDSAYAEELIAREKMENEKMLRQKKKMNLRVFSLQNN